jgi:hypothetical protein
VVFTLTLTFLLIKAALFSFGDEPPGTGASASVGVTTPLTLAAALAAIGWDVLVWNWVLVRAPPAVLAAAAASGRRPRGYTALRAEARTMAGATSATGLPYLGSNNEDDDDDDAAYLSAAEEEDEEAGRAGSDGGSEVAETVCPRLPAHADTHGHTWAAREATAHTGTCMDVHMHAQRHRVPLVRWHTQRRAHGHTEAQTDRGRGRWQR